MKKHFLAFPIILLLTLGFFPLEGDAKMDNPFFTEYKTPYQTPPFDKIKLEHYLPAFKAGIKQQEEAIKSIIANKNEPNFDNTILALEYSGELLTKVSNVFFAMTSANTNDELKAINKKVSPMLSKNNDNINLNLDLFNKVKEVYNKREKLELTKEQNILLEKYYKSFVRGGANLDNEAKDKFRKINEELSMLSLNFSENVLSETNKFELVIDNKEDLAGLTEAVIDMGASEAKSKGQEGKWIYTIQRTSMYPFLTYSTRRDLREKIYKGYITKGDHNDELDNKKIASKMVSLRLKRAKILGYKSHAHFILEENMAKNPEKVYALYDKLWTPALNRAKEELKEMQAISDSEGNNFKLESWDWWHYAEKLKVKKYNLNEEDLRPYFEVNNVIDGVFGLATSLFGVTFEERHDIPKYHPDVKVFEVNEANGKHIGILFTDYFPRASKRGGAWMDVFRKQSIKDGKFITPVIYNVGNFTKPTETTPALLSLDNVNTLFHEFGHAIHGLLSNCNYETLSGTSTPRDFVEFPSQVMENWCFHKDVIKSYAKHYKTGEIIPDELIEKLSKSSLHNQGFQTVESLAAGILDMDYHTVTDEKEINIDEFEKNTFSRIGLIPEIISRYRTTYFSHIFAGGYSAGYYGYIWSEVLDADAFDAFKSTGNVLDKNLAEKYREYILSKGSTEDVMELYKQFRGQEPSITPLLEKRGLN